jgi:dTDP-4-amino-4,6-dideoxygalactose transaminase
MTLALFGGAPVISGPLKRFSTIGQEEADAAAAVCDKYPLSGFLGGSEYGGHWVTSLEARWQQIFKVKHAIACNSATSGLFAACVATKVNSESHVLTTPFTMSATAAAPALLGAKITFRDIEDKTFNLNPDAWEMLARGYTHCIVTNLFGHPARLGWWRKAADVYGFILIEDNAQSPFAMCENKYAGTWGHVGVFSLNVHKHIQVGEGGIIVTDDDKIARACRHYINHGELAGDTTPGLNLRMTEVTAAMAHAQLNKVPHIILGRQRQAQALTTAVDMFDWVRPPEYYVDCTHVYYAWACKLLANKINIRRERLVEAITAEGFPIKSGYTPLHYLRAFGNASMPYLLKVTERMHNEEIAIVENCTYSFTDVQIFYFTTILQKIEAHRNELRNS